MFSERRGSRDKTGNSTAQEAPQREAAETDRERTTGQTAEPKRRRFRMSRVLRAKLLSSGLPGVLPVTCGDLRGELHLKKVGSGSRGPSVRYGGQWLTPNQFENLGGQGYSKNWKRSIRHERTPLHFYVKLGLIRLHQQRCDCELCRTPLAVTGRNTRTEVPKPAKKKDRPRAATRGGSCVRGRRHPSSVNVYRRRGRGKKATNSSRKSEQSRSQSLLVGQRGNTNPTRVREKSFAIGPKKPPDGLKSGSSVIGVFPTKLSPKRQVEDIGGNRSTQAQLISKTVNSDKLNRVDRDSRMENSPVDRLSSDSIGTTATGSVLLQPSTDLQLIASASATLKQGTLLTVVDRTLQSPSGLPSGSKSSKPPPHSWPTPSAFDGRVDSAVLKSSDSVKSFFTEYASQVPSPRLTALRSRVAATVDKAGLSNRDVESWTIDHVAGFVNAAGYPCQSSQFREHRINGEALLHIRERHLVENMKLKLGTSLRLYSLIHCLQTRP